ncbi:uncharacterized protein LOC129943248 [Eupeodes corollae]|uniref:uncharacterized protein LOC129943248 n=1 Tax=Eupeodes corollae TaxID=290404 RepID=UPI0024931A05|nr:uncharacterized protein LOC129943248 [Eupeodes corollae]
MSDPDENPPHPTITPRSSLGSGALSCSSGSSISPSTSSSTASNSAKTAVSECLGAWLNYLQVLNNLCASGYRLAQTLTALEQWGHQSIEQQQQQTNVSQQPQTASSSGSTSTSTQFTGPWDDLARATAVATSTVKSHIVAVLQDFISTPLAPTTAVPGGGDVTLSGIQTAAVGTPLSFQQQETQDHQRTRDHNQQIILENAQTMINIQHQFCAASYDAFSSLMCCFVCQAPVGFAHDQDCAMIHQKPSLPSDGRSQTPSPHFGPMIPPKPEVFRGPTATDIRGTMFGSGSTHASSEHVYAGMDQTRGASPHQEIRGPSPIQGFLDNVRGPLPNPGTLLGMKMPFYRGSKSPLNFPLFPLNGQRRWSEAAAGEVRSGESAIDAESQMRRWSMPWEASKTDKNTVTWHQTRIMPTSKLAVPASKASSERSPSTTPDSFVKDSMWQNAVSSQDGLAEAIQLLSCRPAPRPFGLQQQQSLPTQQLPPMGPPFIEEPAAYEMWPTEGNEDRLPSIKFPPRDKERDDTNP